MTIGMTVGKLATMVDKFTKVVLTVVARPTMPNTALVAVVRCVFLQGQQILLNSGYGKMEKQNMLMK